MTLRVLSLPKMAKPPEVLPELDSQADSTIMKSNAFSNVLRYEVGPLKTKPNAMAFKKASPVKITVVQKSSCFQNFYCGSSGSLIGDWKHSENVEIRITMMMNASNRSSLTSRNMACLIFMSGLRQNRALPLGLAITTFLAFFL